jgi:hypothetical protein
MFVVGPRLGSADGKPAAVITGDDSGIGCAAAMPAKVPMS